ncbi:tatD [Mytilus edulis]|uniref:TatD n=1 Tax=Mytilus edulis TaxID=6550 RepID=A0A8S3UUG5_MYTED|nr:tatD [Mytilus edulis]
MDDELDYGPFDGEIPERLEEDTRIKGSSRNLSKARLCPVCPGRFTNVRRHVFHQHLPWYTNPLTACWTCHKQFGQNKMLENHCLELHNCNIADNIFKEEYQSVWTELMNGLLLELCQRYDKKTLDHLVEYVRTEAVFKQCQSAVFHWTDIPLLNFYNKKNRFDVEVIHAVFPPSAIYSLVHWKILALLLKGTEDAENLITFEKEISLYQCSIQKAIMVTDSHFHLDKMKQQARFSGLPIYKWKDGESVYQIRHLVANYAFPRRWPTIEEMGEIRRDRRIRSTAGIHPRIVKGEEMSVLNSWITDLEMLICVNRMIAVGECGLDSSDKPNSKELKKQVHVFEEQLRIAKRQHLLVLFIAGETRR